jgi:NAD(P)-dependent dehydrogenase (short-subunit alcohol dehydrogenase family)
LKVVEGSAIVTGGAGGLGSATARRLVEMGMFVTLFDRDGTGAHRVAQALGDRAVAVTGDTTVDTDVEGALDAATSSIGLSLLVNVAGGGAHGRLTVRGDGVPHGKDAFITAMKMNAYGTFNMSRLCAAAMAHNKPDQGGQRGVVINTGSIAGIEGQSGLLAYGAAKAAILGMTLPMARDLAPSAFECARSPQAS